jgi:hypothetical protein
MSIYLGIPPESGIDWKSFNWFYVQHQLQTWARASAKEHARIEVRTISSRRHMEPTDVLIYLVGGLEPQDSVLQRRGLPFGQDVAAGVTIGYCGGAISEVYVNVCTSGFAIAATIYHELLHNKFMGDINFDVHATDGGNFTASIAPFTQPGPSIPDQRLLGIALTRDVPQNQIGFDPVKPLAKFCPK